MSFSKVSVVAGLQEFRGLLNLGATLYVIGEDSKHPNPAELLRLNAATGATTRLFPLKKAAGESCFSTTVSSATAIYAVCAKLSDPKATGEVMLHSMPSPRQPQCSALE